MAGCRDARPPGAPGHARGGAAPAAGRGLPGQRGRPRAPADADAGGDPRGRSAGAGDRAGAPSARRCRPARRRCLAWRAGARAALGATGAREDRRQSVLRDPILHGAGRRRTARVRPRRARVAMGHGSHPRQELHRQRGGSHGREAEAVFFHHPGSPATARLPGQRRRHRHSSPGSRDNRGGDARGTGRLIDRDERAQVATIDLRAGRKAKASAAYASARAYFSAGMALLDERDWGSQYELTFSLWLERAECEYLSGDFDKADQLIVELLQRAASNVEFAHASCLKVDLHVVKGENPQAVDSGLTCLRLFGIDLPAHPTWEQVEAEYETVWPILNGRPIEGLIDLPLMTDLERQAVMRGLSVLVAPAYFTAPHFCCFQVCRMVNVSMQRGTSAASAFAFVQFGLYLGRNFHRYREGYRFGRVACDMVEKYGFISSKAKVYVTMAAVAFWAQPIATAIDFLRAGSRIAIETGDLVWACYSMFNSVANLLVRNDPLDAVWRESESGLDFVRKARYGDLADIIVSQQRFIATMQGRTATFSSFSDAQFDEAAFEAQLTGDRMPLMICCYWIGKLKARFLSGDYAEALAAADKARALLWGAFG